MKHKYIALLLLIVFIISLAPQIDLAQIEAKAIDDELLPNITNIKPDISDSFVSPSQLATITYSDIAIDFNIDDCSYESAGINVISMIKDDDVLEFHVQPIVDEGFGELKIHITTETDILEDTVYVYNTGDKTFFDKVSKYQAWYSAMLDLYEQNTEDNIVISEAEICDRYSAFTAPLIEGVPTVTNNDTNTVIFAGHIGWEVNDTPANNKPTLDMRNTLIEIGIKNLLGFNKIASGYTDENGNYEIVINPDDWVDNKDIYFRICLEGKTFEVKTFWFFPHYYYEYNLGKIASLGSTVNYNVQIKCEPNEDVYKATYIHQAMTIAERFAEKMGFQSDNFIRAAFPAESETYYIPSIGEYVTLSDMAFCYGDFWDNCICAIGINSWQNTETIVHEYSHYIQCSMGNYGEDIWEILIENPNHIPNLDLYKEKGDKSFAMHLSWTEGWGYVFSIMAQKYYASEYGGLANLETSPSVTSSFLGEFQENSVKMFLWSLLDYEQMDCGIDTTNVNLDYQLPWTPQEWWNMTTVQGTYRLPDFIALIENEEYNLGVELDYKAIKEVIAEKLTEYKIAPEVSSAITSGPNQAPEIEWIPNGSTETDVDGKSHSNNRFYVNILDGEKNVVYRSQELKDLDEFCYPIPQNIWNDIISEMDCEDKVYITIEGYQYDIDKDDQADVSGPYYSEYYPYAKNSGHDCSYEKINNIRHKFVCNTCDLEREYDHALSGEHKGSLNHYEQCELCDYEGVASCSTTYVSKNDDTHSLKCSVCDYVSNSAHNKICNSVNYINHTYSCSKCDYSKTEPHNFEQVDDHVKNCSDCGYTLTGSHSLTYTEIDDDYHLVECFACSHAITEEHSMYKKSVGNNQHADKCRYCGYIDESTRERHTYEYWVYVNSTTHRSECGCGAWGTEISNHVFNLPDKLTGEMICRGCGYTKTFGSDDGFIIMSNTKVSLNGSYILPDGNIVLVDEDVEAYLNGTLVFYDKDELPEMQ